MNKPKQNKISNHRGGGMGLREFENVCCENLIRVTKHFFLVEYLHDISIIMQVKTFCKKNNVIFQNIETSKRL